MIFDLRGTDYQIEWGITKHNIMFAVALYKDKVIDQFLGTRALTKAVLCIAKLTGDTVASNLIERKGVKLWL